MKQKNTAISNTQSKNIAIRLKLLREEKGISHETLSHATGISKDTLIKYEKTDEYNTSFGANKGMRIDFAVSLAKFYNTSTDYILCNTDIKSPDVTISDICEKTGLKESAIKELIKIQQLCKMFPDSRTYNDFIKTLNVLLEKENGIKILDSISQYLFNLFTAKNGVLVYYNGFERKIDTEELSDTELYLNIMPQIKDFKKELSEVKNNVTE